MFSLRRLRIGVTNRQPNKNAFLTQKFDIVDIKTQQRNMLRRCLNRGICNFGIFIMTYLKKLKEEFKKHQNFETEINILIDLLKVENYFQVIMLAPQLMESIVSEIDESGREYIIRKMGEPDKDSLHVQKLYNKLIREETIKARVALYLVALYENDYCGFPFSRNDFVKYFSKLESVIACRNHLSHEYYKKHISNQKIKRAAKEALEIVELLSLHPALSY